MKKLSKTTLIALLLLIGCKQYGVDPSKQMQVLSSGMGCTIDMADIFGSSRPMPSSSTLTVDSLDKRDSGTGRLYYYVHDSAGTTWEMPADDLAHCK